MKMFAGFALMGMASAAPMTSSNSAFVSWMSKHGKSYASAEETASRQAIFEANVAMIEEHNANSLASYTMGVGPFTDMTHEEWSSQYVSGECDFASQEPTNVVELTGQADDSVDWRSGSIVAVTPVKNQAKCGSCWSFSTTGSIEGAWKIAGNDLVSLSEQQLVDCAGGKYGNKGCQGGSMDSAMEYVKNNGGLDTENDYEYTAKNGVCDKDKEAQHAADITGHVNVPQNNADQLKLAVAKGPVSIAIEADKPAFQHYKSGVLDSSACGTKLDHGVLIVGYGTDSTTGDDYWIVKNSWGATWGEKGYVRIANDPADKKGVCGINMQPVYPTAVKGPPPAPGPSPGPSPAPPSPGGACAVPTAQRTRCGFLLNKEQCETKGCCYDDRGGFFAHCYHKGSGPIPPSPPPGPPAPPTPGGGHYGNPTSGCKADEEAVSIQGLAGDFCSPGCSTLHACPTDVPGGATALPECILEAQGSQTPNHCALICGGSGGHGGTCPPGASCEQIQNTGLCTYPKSTPLFVELSL